MSDYFGTSNSNSNPNSISNNPYSPKTPVHSLQYSHPTDARLMHTESNRGSKRLSEQIEPVQYTHDDVDDGYGEIIKEKSQPIRFTNDLPVRCTSASIALLVVLFLMVFVVMSGICIGWPHAMKAGSKQFGLIRPRPISTPLSTPIPAYVPTGRYERFVSLASIFVNYAQTFVPGFGSMPVTTGECMSTLLEFSSIAAMLCVAIISGLRLSPSRVHFELRVSLASWRTATKGMISQDNSFVAVGKNVHLYGPLLHSLPANPNARPWILRYIGALFIATVKLIIVHLLSTLLFFSADIAIGCTFPLQTSWVRRHKMDCVEKNFNLTTFLFLFSIHACYKFIWYFTRRTYYASALSPQKQN